jgi:3-deoxy-manno-octulosonate cytidylyltransferase (CMP-KDO synthetase)
VSILGVIPARFASTRFPGKPLAEILGKSMIRRVYEQAKQSKLLSDVVVATDDERIARHVEQFGGKFVITSATHPSGTDRCFEALRSSGVDATYVINIQGDEPFIDPSQIDLLAQLCDGQTELATLMIRCDSHEVLFDKGEVKIVRNTQNEALYFSREVIPHLKKFPQQHWHQHFEYFRHVGMYAYRKDVLEKITSLPTSLLEQLRWLENGFKIKLAETKFDSHCVDSPEDIPKVLRLMRKD